MFYIGCYNMTKLITLLNNNIKVFWLNDFIFDTLNHTTFNNLELELDF